MLQLLDVPAVKPARQWQQSFQLRNRPETTSRFRCGICECKSWNDSHSQLDDSMTGIPEPPSDFETVTKLAHASLRVCHSTNKR